MGHIVHPAPAYLANIARRRIHSHERFLWVSLLAGWNFRHVVTGEEESYLVKEFLEYEPYRAKTSRLIPFIY
jgi:protein-S-isoprenylcysteine O-methyltransferase Ste14